MKTITTTSGREIPLREVREGLDFLLDKSPVAAEPWQYQGWQDGDPRPGEVWKISRIYTQSLNRPVGEHPRINPKKGDDLVEARVQIEKNDDTYHLPVRDLPHWGRIVDRDYEI